jgi:hypothetical protein
MGGTASQASPIRKNQTRDEWITQRDVQRGTGIFVRQYSGGATRPKEFVESLSYDECIIQGAEALAFKWVPHSVASVSELKAMPCPREECVDTCVRPACVCIDKLCQ